jgi:hypothetical protein
MMMYSHCLMRGHLLLLLLLLSGAVHGSALCVARRQLWCWWVVRLRRRTVGQFVGEQHDALLCSCRHPAC